MNAVAACGLQLYRFGQTISLCFFTSTWRPDSFYDRVAANRREGLHTLCLLDIRVKEPTVESLCRGRKVYEPPRYMSANLAAQQLLEVEAARGGGAYCAGTLCVAVARIGQDDQRIVCATLAEMAAWHAPPAGEDGDEYGEGRPVIAMGAPLHSLVLVGETHPLEMEVLEQMYRYKPSKLPE
jgi:diphthine synthase